MRIAVLIVASAMPWLAVAQSSFTDARDHRPTDSFAVSACSDAATREVRSRNPMAGEVAVGDADASPSADTRTDVNGTGSYKDATGASHDFTFRCTYDLKASATSGVMVNLAQ